MVKASVNTMKIIVISTRRNIISELNGSVLGTLTFEAVSIRVSRRSSREDSVTTNDISGIPVGNIVAVNS